jgi:large subunit ribosomal protein L4
MAKPTAPVLSGGKPLSLSEACFGQERNDALVHEVVKAELAARRQGTSSTKTRGLVSGGRSKPWRQKGTGRARAGTTRAPHWTGGGVAFPTGGRNFEVKVNRKARHAALRGALSSHASNGTFGVLDGSGFDTPSTKRATDLIASWGKDAPLVVVATDEEQNVIKSFRNIQSVVVCAPSELNVAAAVWARSLLVTQEALEAVQGRAS